MKSEILYKAFEVYAKERNEYVERLGPGDNYRNIILDGIFDFTRICEILYSLTELAQSQGISKYGR